MGQGYLVDTNCVIDYLETRLPERANQFIDNIAVQFSVITRIEILVWPGATSKQLQILSDFIASSTVFDFDEKVILKTIEIRRFFRLKLPDAIIAATALVHELELITRNIKDFERAVGLTSIDPYKM
jgi:predicted nucleic acid-binding protein